RRVLFRSGAVTLGQHDDLQSAGRARLGEGERRLLAERSRGGGKGGLVGHEDASRRVQERRAGAGLPTLRASPSAGRGVCPTRPLRDLANDVSFLAMDTSQNHTVHHLARAEGRLAYTVEGSGPLVVAAPGMGDLRATSDDVVPHLVAAGYRVAVMDLRGHGDSDTTFSTHGDEATASDYVALVEHLASGPAVLLGSSMAASAAVVAAAERPDLVRGLVLLDGFLREPTSPAKLRAPHVLSRLVIARPWGAAICASVSVQPIKS